MCNVQGENYAYDYAIRLTSVTGKGTLTYDPVSRLRTVNDGTSTTTFLYDGQDMIAEYNGSTVTKRYVHGAGVDEPLVEYTGSGTSSKVWLVTDVRGSIVAHASASGVSLATNRYDPYGQPQSSNTGRFQYTGQVWLEELDLYYYKARFYNPNMRRFLTADPIGYGDGMNMYAYVSGDPVNNTDPSGMNCYTAYGGSTTFRSSASASHDGTGSNVTFEFGPPTVRQSSSTYCGGMPGEGRRGEHEIIYGGVSALGWINTGSYIPKLANATCGAAVSFTAGMVNGLTFGLYENLSDGVDNFLPGMGFAYPDNSFSESGEIGSYGVGGLRVAYAGLAKGIPLVAKNGTQAVTYRNRLKVTFRMGLFPKYKMHTPAQIVKKYGNDGAIQAASRTNAPLNTGGALVGGQAALPSGTESADANSKPVCF